MQRCGANSGVVPIIRHPRQMQQGFSLPLTWMILIPILIIAYFYDWKVLLIILIIVMAISLAAFLFDLFTDTGSESKQLNFWFHSNQKLMELSKLIEIAFETKPFSLGAENVWEWMEAESQDGLFQFNITRKHKDYSYPIQINVIYKEGKSLTEIREYLGRKFTNALKKNIKFGSVEYLGGNDFEFTQEGIFTYEE